MPFGNKLKVEKKCELGIEFGSPTADLRLRKDGVANGTRTRNIQNHNLGLYH